MRGSEQPWIFTTCMCFRPYEATIQWWSRHLGAAQL